MERDYADRYGALEEKHWWFRARRLILRTLLRQAVIWRPGLRALEVGVGPGLNLYTLYPEGADLHGLEPDPENAERARHLGPIPVYTGGVEAIPEPLSRVEFDLITFFDVLEHIEDDRAALRVLRARLNPGGRIALTVPAYMWLWGQQDKVSMHYRRYTRRRLAQLLSETGFRVVRSTYFNTVLFPFIAMVRLVARRRQARIGKERSDFDYSTGPFNNLLYLLFAAEGPCLRLLDFPFGVSIYVVAEVVSA